MKRFIVLPGDFFALKISGRAKDVLGMLIGHDYRGDGRVWPSQARIAEKLDTGRAMVTRAINELEKENLVSRIKRGRSTGYQIAERFLIAPSARRPARSAPTGQRSLLLPINGAESAPIDAPDQIGDDSAPIATEPIGADSATIGADLSPGSSGMKKFKNPSSTTESRCRAREGKNLGSQAKSRFARSSGIADPAQRKELHRQRVWRFVQATKSAAELTAFIADQLGDAARAQTSLDHYSRLMEAARWDDRAARQASHG